MKHVLQNPDGIERARCSCGGWIYSTRGRSIAQRFATHVRMSDSAVLAHAALGHEIAEKNRDVLAADRRPVTRRALRDIGSATR